MDCDGDGIPNATDAFPSDACAALDSDGDGQPDVLILPADADDDTCTTASSLTMDTDDDNDQVPDATDAFPTDACAALDSDGDGQPDALILPADADDDACTTASPLTEDSEPSTPALLALDTTISYTASAGENRFRLTITNPVADAYKIGIMETGSGADDNAANVTALTATTTSTVNGRTDHTTRLRRGGLTPITNPIAADGSNVGVVYTFLPGDDAAATKPDFSMLWGSYPNGAGQLAAEITYTIAVRATAGTTYSLRVEKITEFPRLPSNIQTRARRGMCANTPPNVVEGDTVTCSEGGPSVTGQGLYLIYSSTANQLRVKIELREVNSVYFDTSSDSSGVDTDMDGVSDPTSINFLTYNDCVDGSELDASSITKLFFDDPLTTVLTETLGTDEHVYCVELISTSAGNLASDRLQFTLNVPPMLEASL